MFNVIKYGLVVNVRSKFLLSTDFHPKSFTPIMSTSNAIKLFLNE